MNRLILPLPPSQNHAYKNVSVSKRIKTDESIAYMNTAGWEARIWASRSGWTFVTKGTKVVMKLWFHWPDNLRRDTHNREKILLDALQGVLFEDDQWVLVQEQDFDVDRANPRIELELEVVGS